MKLGLIQMEMRKYDKAIQIFKMVLEKNPEADRIHDYLGSIYEETKQADLAMQELKLIKPKPNFTGTRHSTSHSC